MKHRAKAHVEKMREKITEKTCKFCGYEHLNIHKIHVLKHPYGRKIRSMPGKYKIFIVCPVCKEEWSLWDLEGSRDGK